MLIYYLPVKVFTNIVQAKAFPLPAYGDYDFLLDLLRNGFVKAQATITPDKATPPMPKRKRIQDLRCGLFDVSNVTACRNHLR